MVAVAIMVLYVNGIDKRATANQELVEAVTATEMIEAGESVQAAIDAGKLETTEVRRADLVEGFLSSTGSISGDVALAPIYPGEQIIADKFGTLGDADSLLIPAKKMGVAVELSDPARVAGFVNPGSDVAIFLSADPVEFTPDGGQTARTPYTGMLLPKVKVIGVGTTSTTSTTTTNEEGEEVVEEVPRTILTLAVDQAQAEKLIYAARNGELYFALLNDKSVVNPDQTGVKARDVMPKAFQ